MFYPFVAVLLGVIAFYLTTLGIKVIWSLTVVAGAIFLFSALKAKTDREDAQRTVISGAVTVVLLYFSIAPYITI